VKCLRQFHVRAGEHGCPGSVVISPDRKWAANGGGGAGIVRVWDLQTGKLISALEPNLEGGIEASADGHWLAAVGDDDTARLWHW
jgi:WD40 repeat protein